MQIMRRLKQTYKPGDPFTPSDINTITSTINDIQDSSEQISNKVLTITDGLSQEAYPTVGAVKTYMKSIIANLQSIRMQIVDVLPDTGDTSIIYLLKNHPESPYYDQIVWMNNKYEYIGNTKIEPDYCIQKIKINGHIVYPYEGIADLGLVATRKSTLFGYGIEDAKIEGNTITLGKDSIVVVNQAYVDSELNKEIHLTERKTVIDEETNKISLSPNVKTVLSRGVRDYLKVVKKPEIEGISNKYRLQFLAMNDCNIDLSDFGVLKYLDGNKIDKYKKGTTYLIEIEDGLVKNLSFS